MGNHKNYKLYAFSAILGIKPGALHMLNTYSTTGPSLASVSFNLSVITIIGFVLLMTRNEALRLQRRRTQPVHLLEKKSKKETQRVRLSIKDVNQAVRAICFYMVVEQRKQQ